MNLSKKCGSQGCFDIYQPGDHHHIVTSSSASSLTITYGKGDTLGAPHPNSPWTCTCTAASCPKLVGTFKCSADFYGSTSLEVGLSNGAYTFAPACATPACMSLDVRTCASPTNSIVAFPTNPTATSNPVASSNCGFDAAQGYQSATNGGSCFIRDASNMPVVVDYTAFRYTTYSFTIQMLENGQTPTKNNNIGPHGGIKICNTDGTSQTRGTSPELWFIDRTQDFGYGLYNGDWGHVSTAETQSVSQGLWPDAPRVWEIVMEWDGASYKLVSWKVDGTAIPSIAGQISGCGADTSAAGQVRVWSYDSADKADYDSADTFKVKDFTVTQGGPSPPVILEGSTAGYRCSPVTMINTAAECQAAASALGLTWQAVHTGAHYQDGCSVYLGNKVAGPLVYFNPRTRVNGGQCVNDWTFDGSDGSCNHKSICH
eukprot:scaffold54610_cov60-Phaeocystis_antarctica.AAC.1